MNISQILFKNSHKYIRIFIFFSVFPALIFLQLRFDDKESLEKRAIAPIPSFIQSFVNTNPITKADIARAAQQIESFYNDRFPQRNSIIQSFNQARLSLNQKSPVDQTALGKEGFFYYNTKEHREIYDGSNLFSDEEVKRVGDILIQRKNFVESLGKKYYIAISATKGEIYPENAPANWGVKGEKTRSDQIYEYLKSQAIPVYFSKSDLLEAKNTTQVFYKTDSHWNMNGALTGFSSFYKSIGDDIEIPKIGKDFEFVPNNNYLGDFARLMGTGYLYEDPTPTIKFFNQKSKLIVPMSPVAINDSGKVKNVEYKAYSNDKINSGSALLFRSSYHDNLEALVAESFNRVDMYKLPTGFDAEIVKKSPAEFVIQEFSTASLYEPIENNKF